MLIFLLLITGIFQREMDLMNLDDLFKIFKAAAQQPQQLDPGRCFLN